MEFVVSLVGMLIAWISVRVVATGLRARPRKRAFASYRSSLHQLTRTAPRDDEPHRLIARAEQHLATGRRAADLSSQGFGLGGCAIPLSLLAVFIGLAGQGLLRRSDEADIVDFLLLAIPTLGVGYLAWGSVAWHREESQRHMYGLALRTPIAFLYFRPFSFDLSTTASVFNVPVGTAVSKRVAVAFEEVLGAICLNAGVALRSIGRVPNQLGPAALSASDAEWQGRAGELMKSANVVLVVPGGSPGSMWEIEQILGSQEVLEKTLWLMPPAEIIDHVEEFEAAWNLTVQSCQNSFNLHLPQYSSHGALLCLQKRPPGEVALETRPFSLDLIAALAEHEAASLLRTKPHRSTSLSNGAIATLVTLLALLAFLLVFGVVHVFL